MATRPHDVPHSAAHSELPEPPPSRLASLWANPPGLLLTASYLIITAIGLVYDASLYAHFRINIAEYAETSDFLLAAARAPLIILLSLLPLPLLLLLAWFDRWSRRRFPRYAAFSRRSSRIVSRASPRIRRALPAETSRPRGRAWRTIGSTARRGSIIHGTTRCFSTSSPKH